MSTMKDNRTMADGVAGHKGDNRPAQAARKLYLFCIGALATTIEDSYGLMGKLVENRDAAEKEGHRRVNEAIRRRKPIDEPAAGPSKPNTGLPAMPTKANIRMLDDQLTRLDQQLEAMSKG